MLLCHGFTGSPQSLRPWAEYLAEAGLSVSLPRLPGHGTTWQEMARTRWEDWFAEVNRAFEELRSWSDEIFVMGLSMGGCLALRLAELHGPAVSGLVLVNPSVTADTRLFLLAPAAEAGRSLAARGSPATSRRSRPASAGTTGFRSRPRPRCRACGGSPASTWAS